LELKLDYCKQADGGIKRRKEAWRIKMVKKRGGGKKKSDRWEKKKNQKWFPSVIHIIAGPSGRGRGSWPWASKGRCGRDEEDPEMEPAKGFSHHAKNPVSYWKGAL